MRAFEVPVTMDEGKIELPENLARLLASGAPARMIVLIDQDEDELWTTASRKAFLAGYAEGDGSYDSID
jgi:hypothetical protein